MKKPRKKKKPTKRRRRAARVKPIVGPYQLPLALQMGLPFAPASAARDDAAPVE